MFDKFGEIERAADFNELAENLKAEGDTGSLMELAAENGIDPEAAQAFLDGELPFLADAMTFAIGKITMEEKKLKPKEIMEDWVDYIKAQCNDSEAMAAAVRKTDRSLEGCIAKLLQWSYQNAYSIPSGITEAAGIRNATVKLGIPGSGTAKRIIREYYLKEADA